VAVAVEQEGQKATVLMGELEHPLWAALEVKVTEVLVDREADLASLVLQEQNGARVEPLAAVAVAVAVARMVWVVQAANMAEGVEAAEPQHPETRQAAQAQRV
jgi:hypothetical protein